MGAHSSVPPKSPRAGFYGNITLQRILLMSEKVIYLAPNATSKIVSVWGSAPDPARGAYVSSTTFFSRPTMALSSQPPQLFSLVTSYRLHSAFQRRAYDYIIISTLCNSARNMLHNDACANAALLTYSAPPYTLTALRWNRGRVQRAYSGVPYSSTPLPNPS